MVNVVTKYLEKNKHGSQKESFEDLFLSHPNYPSLFAITDSLTILGIENIAIKIPKEQFVELPDSFLAVFNQELVLVSKKSDTVSIETENGGRKNVTFNEFLAGWNEVIVVIEPNTKIDVKSGIHNVSWLQYSFPVVALIIISLLYNAYSLRSIALLLISISGLIVSAFIIAEKLGIKNEVVSKFCNGNPNISCNSVIKSGKSESSKWIDFSDLPLLFFGINTLSLLIEPQTDAVVGGISLMALPIIGYSIWVQKFQLQKWCVLCLGISSLIFLQAIVFCFQDFLLLDFFSISLFGFLFSFLLFSSVWLFLKPVLEKKLQAESDVSKLKRFKRSYSVFKSLTKEIRASEDFDKLTGIGFGNKNAAMQLTVILSPSCGHCHNSFWEAYELVSKFPNSVFLNVLFNVNPGNNDNPYKVVVQSLLTIRNHNTEKAREALIDWHIMRMELDNWKEKWAVDFIDMKASEQMHQQYNWCLSNRFNYTPVKIINNKLFPGGYEINELKFFLNDFSEEKEINRNSILA